MNTDDYRAHIDRLIREQSDETVLNGSHAHASIIVERMFANAESDVSVLTRRFDPRIYGALETIQQAALMLGDSKRTINILTEEVEPESLAEHPFIKVLSKHLDKNLHIRRMPESLRAQIPFNFSVMDDRGYRFERDKTKAVAVAKFDDEEFVARLRGFFGSIWDTSNAISVPVVA